MIQSHNRVKSIEKGINQCRLFRGMETSEATRLVTSTSARVVTFSADQVVAMEGDECLQISIILEGRVAILKTYGSGKSVTVTTMSPGDTFGEVMVYTSRPLPSTIVSQTDVELLQIPGEDVIHLCQINPRFLENMMSLLADKVWMLNEKLKLLSYGSIRQKVTSILLDTAQEQKTTDLVVNDSRQQLADRLGIPRPSLSRELVRMRQEGLIDFWKSHIRLLDVEALEDIMLQ